MTNPASRPAETDAARHAEMLSALADGEIDAEQVHLGCRIWREHAEVRRTWHAYHLIADVMRSEQLSSAPVRDAAFISALRGRLAAEPRVLAPQPLRSYAIGRRWAAAGAVVGGAAVVAVIVGVLGEAPSSPAAGPLVVTAPSPGVGVQRVGAAAPAASTQVLVVDGNVLRDARLDAYFDAHRGAAGALPSAVPGGALRSVEMVVPARR